MAEHKVKSLAGVQALVRQFGEKEEIEVRVGNTIASLSDVKPMRKLLRKMIARKLCCVAGVSKLQPFEGIATKVCNAQQILSTLMRITDPKNAGKLIHIANQVPLLLCCSDKLFDSIADLAKDLRRLGRQMENISFAPLPVILLGQDLKAVGKDMKLKLKKKKGSPAEFHGELCRVKRFCNEVYNQAVPLN